MVLPFNYKSMEEWESLFNRHGFAVINKQFLGIPQGSFHFAPRGVLVLEKLPESAGETHGALQDIKEGTDAGRPAALNRKTEKIIKGTNTSSRQIFSRIETYLMEMLEEAGTKEEVVPIDIVVDLSLIPKEDLRENVETWAYLILLCQKLDNVNFIFEHPYSVDENTMPTALLNDIANAAEESEVLDGVNGLKEIIREKAQFFGLDGEIDELLNNRINAGRRRNAVEIPILSKAWLEWARDKGMELEPNQYPVALDGFTTVEDEGVALRNLEAALTIGLSKAALVIAQRKDKKKGEGGDEEFLKLIEETQMLPRLQNLYDVFFGGKRTITRDTLKNMIYSDSAVRLNLAISLALPPITRMAVEKLQDFHKKIQLFLQAA